MTGDFLADGSLAEALGGYASVLWKNWPMGMIVRVLEVQQHRFSLSGICPHCNRDSVFLVVAGPHTEPGRSQAIGQIFKYCAAMQCQGCAGFILGVASGPQGDPTHMEYVTHYPLGQPNDNIPTEIPPDIAADFKEAIRCQWIEASKAAVAMCGRALEASCINLGADADKKISEQIDWLASEGKITTPLKEMAHKIRLGRNRGAHPPSDGLEDITAEDAELLLEFTRDFFQHVYVMPEKLKSLDLKRKTKSS